MSTTRNSLTSSVWYLAILHTTQEPRSDKQTNIYFRPSQAKKGAILAHFCSLEIPDAVSRNPAGFTGFVLVLIVGSVARPMTQVGKNNKFESRGNENFPQFITQHKNHPSLPFRRTDVPHAAFLGCLQKTDSQTDTESLNPTQKKSNSTSCQTTACMSLVKDRAPPASPPHLSYHFPRKLGQSPPTVPSSSQTGTSVFEALQQRTTSFTSAEPACKARWGFKRFHLSPVFSSILFFSIFHR